MDQRLIDARVLIVDDEFTNVLLMKRTLEQVGFTNIQGITEPKQVSTMLTQFKPDILLLDLRMPVLDGCEVIKIVRNELDPEDFLPIIVLTADDTQETKRQALMAGANDYLTKPFDLFEVVLRTRNQLRIRFLHCDLREQNGRLEENVRERTKELEDAYAELFERLARVSEMRDDFTGEHTRRVGAMAERIALTMGLSPSEAQRIGIASQLHDLGKTGIPDEILLKPGKLSQSEFETIKSHTEMGVEILKNSRSPVLQLAEEIAWTHHEHWSGGGYPRGLTGESIPISGRIVAVCDVFDALTNERPYKRAWPIGETVAEIERLSGTQFDPNVVCALKEVLAQSERRELAA